MCVVLTRRIPTTKTCPVQRTWEIWLGCWQINTLAMIWQFYYYYFENICVIYLIRLQSAESCSIHSVPGCTGADWINYRFIYCYDVIIVAWPPVCVLLFRMNNWFSDINLFAGTWIINVLHQFDWNALVWILELVMLHRSCGLLGNESRWKSKLSGHKIFFFFFRNDSTSCAWVLICVCPFYFLSYTMDTRCNFSKS